MDHLDEQLRRAFARREAPEGFAEQVIARAQGRARRAMVRWFATAAAILLAAGGGEYAYRKYRGELARRQVLLAIKITAGRMNRIQAEVRGPVQ